MEPLLRKMPALTCIGKEMLGKQGLLQSKIKTSSLQFSAVHNKASGSWKIQPSNFGSTCIIASDAHVPEPTKIDINIVETSPPEKKPTDPLVLLFGWAGASHKNLSKYAEIYTKAGCTTVQYSLPSEYIMHYTSMVPDVMGSYVAKLRETQRLNGRPILIHCLSDGGIMCYQGLTILEKLWKENEMNVKALDVKGVVFDSCCGPYPEIKLRDIAKFLLINLYCCHRDQIGLAATSERTYKFASEILWPNYLRNIKGLPVEMSKMEGVWCGDFGKNHSHNFPERREMFIFSKRDFYLPYKYVEEHILPLRAERLHMTAWQKFHKSHHVQHLRKYNKDYKKTVNHFIKTNLEEDTSEENSQDLKVVRRKRKKRSSMMDHSGISFY